MNSIARYLDGEDGATTVDWVVLTAAVVGLGLVISWSVLGGTAVNGLSISLQQLDEEIDFTAD